MFFAYMLQLSKTAIIWKVSFRAFSESNWTLRLSLCQNVLANSLEKVYCLCYFWYKSLNSHVMQNHVFHFRIQIRICCYFCKLEKKFSILCKQFLDIVSWSVITFTELKSICNDYQYVGFVSFYNFLMYGIYFSCSLFADQA